MWYEDWGMCRPVGRHYLLNMWGAVRKGRARGLLCSLRLIPFEGKECLISKSRRVL